tara:strand:+ start:23 stop:331 length:309 start_codon:yes stop_codon:yes gene_type:complete
MIRLIILILFVLIPFSSNAEYVVFTYDCGKILKSERNNNRVQQDLIKSWLQGYMTARNYENNSKKGDGVNLDSIFYALIKYCRENPLKNSNDAALYIYDYEL